ncbi:MAG: hypothetical protein BWK79_00175 [Beggiatoa sp. IS2]|nr:MAG: hypothetical protein BWK78_00065 [Thiotrichaceae bacterium IS1]OQW96070.1 MAG: hypothetical protein BWK79_00175 [Beggiatoa sp. IS2]
MSYEIPPGNQVVFNFTVSGYLPPPTNLVVFDFLAGVEIQKEAVACSVELEIVAATPITKDKESFGGLAHPEIYLQPCYAIPYITEFAGATARPQINATCGFTIDRAAIEQTVSLEIQATTGIEPYILAFSGTTAVEVAASAWATRNFEWFSGESQLEIRSECGIFWYLKEFTGEHAVLSLNANVGIGYDKVAFGGISYPEVTSQRAGIEFYARAGLSELDVHSFCGVTTYGGFSQFAGISRPEILTNTLEIQHWVERFAAKPTLEITSDCGILPTAHVLRISHTLNFSTDCGIYPYVHDVKCSANIDLQATCGIQPDPPPYFTTTPPRAVQYEFPINYTPVAKDMDRDNTLVPAQISAVLLPEFATWDGTTLQGTPPGENTRGFKGHTVILAAKDVIEPERFVFQMFTLFVYARYRTPAWSSNFLKWIFANGIAHMLTVELTGMNLVTKVPRTFYFATEPYISEPSDTIPNQPFAPLVADIPLYSRGVKTDLSGTDANWGEISLFNVGDLDELLMAYTFHRRRLVLKIGERDWAYNDFVVVMDGRTGDQGVTASDKDKLIIPIRSDSILLNVPLTTERYATPEGLKDKYKPQCFGGTVDNPLFNVKAVLIDTANHIYQVHNGKIGGIVAVRDNGVEVAGYTTDLLNGTFTLTTMPAGEIRADVVGEALPDNSVPSSVSSLVKHILLTRTELTAEDVDGESFDILDLARGDAVVGYYAEEGNTKVAEVVNWLLASINCYYEFRRDGRLYVRTLLEPEWLQEMPLSIDHDLNSDMYSDEIAITEIIPPASEISFGYQKNWAPLSGFAYFVIEEQPDFKVKLESEHSKITLENADVKTDFISAEPLEIFESLVIDEVSAQVYAEERRVYYSKPRTVFEFEVFKAGSLLNTGDVIRIQDTRFGLLDTPMIVCAVDDSLIEERTIVRAIR